MMTVEYAIWLEIFVAGFGLGLLAPIIVYGRKLRGGKCRRVEPKEKTE